MEWGMSMWGKTGLVSLCKMAKVKQTAHIWLVPVHRVPAGPRHTPVLLGGFYAHVQSRHHYLHYESQ